VVKKAWRVVIVDDSRTSQALLETAMQKRPGFDVVGFVTDPRQALNIVNDLRPDIVTLDLCMPYIDGAMLLDLLAATPRLCKVIVSDTSLQNVALSSKLLNAGASTCLAKRELVSDPNAFFKKLEKAAALACGATYFAHTVKRRPITRAASANAALRPQFPIPLDEKRRIELVRQKHLDNCERESQFDALTKHLVHVTGFPVALINFIDRDTQWTKSSHGLDHRITHREDAFCSFTISQDRPLVVTNASTDPTFRENPLVTGEPHVRSYVGNGIRGIDGVCLGAVCLIDIKPRVPSAEVLSNLAGISEIVAEMIELRPGIAA
jgi:DNA-binding NarL/FixJ family response regulator